METISQSGRATRISSRRLIYTLLIVMCAIGLVYQTLDLVFQYWNQKIVVNIEYEDNAVDSIPGITICYLNGLSLEKMAQRFAEYKKVYDQYLKLAPDLTLKDLDSSNATVRDIMTELITGDAMMDIHRNVIAQLFNLTIAFDYNERMSETTQYKYPIWMEISGYHLNENNSYTNFAINMSNETMSLFTPLETIILDEEVLSDVNLNKYTKKCFTFFSHLNREWRHLKMDFSKMTIVLHYDRRWNSVLELAKHGFEMALHSPDELPDLKQFRNFHFGHSYDIVFNRWTVDLREVRQFDQIKCQEYDLDDELPVNRMHSECVRHCIHDKLKNCWIQKNPFYGQREDVNSCVPLSLRIDRHMSYIAMKLCGYVFECLVVEFERECQNRCPKTCVNHVYNFDVIADRHEWPQAMKEPFPTARISIKHNQLPDQTTKHTPAMSFIQFISGFGGLLGMWLGLSAVAVLDYAIKYLLPSP